MRKPRCVPCSTLRPAADTPGDPLAEPIAVPPAGRRRGATLEHAIFDAVLDQLNAVGYGGLTMEGVAAAARTGKAALYRRWPSKGDLVVDTLNHFLPAFREPPDTGNVRDDIAAVLGAMLEIINGKTGCAMLALMGELERDREFAETVNERVLAPRKAMMKAVLRRAIGRGEIASYAADPLIAEAGPALIIHRLVCEGPPIDPSYATAVLDQVVMPLLRAKAPSAEG